MNFIYKFLTLISLLIIHTAGTAQSDSSNFAKLIGKEPSVEINLGATMLSMLSSATNSEDQGISSILSSLQGISVTVYDIDGANNINTIRSEISNMSQIRTSNGFQKLASIKEDDSLVYIMAKMNEGKLQNLNIFALDDDDELVIIDIKGNIKMTQIGELMEHFDVDLDINGLKINKQD